jgi:hypothetical protein
VRRIDRNVQREREQAHHHPLVGLRRVAGQRDRMVRVVAPVHVGELKLRLEDRGLECHEVAIRQRRD